MTRVLIAVDETDTAVEAARVAHRLFGDLADYLVVNVAERQLPAGMEFAGVGAAWGAAYPVTMPLVAYPAGTGDGGVLAEDSRTGVELAEERATQVAGAADLPHVETIGEVGDPAEAILSAAHDHQADVIVVGSHDRSWFARLLAASVVHDVMRKSTVPVLVVK